MLRSFRVWEVRLSCDPDGVVKLDDHNVKDLNLKLDSSLRSLLFATTIRNNDPPGLMSAQSENASEEGKDVLIKEVLRPMRMAPFQSFPEVITLVGERGCLLSEGQQRVLLFPIRESYFWMR